MDVKAGTKLTDVGVIPEDWANKTISEISDIKTGPFGTLLKADEYYSSQGVPLVSVRDIYEGKLNFDEHTPLVPTSVLRRLPQYILNQGDIVFGRKGGVDRCGIVQPHQAGCFLGSDGIRIRPTKLCHAPFIAYQLQRKEIRTWLLTNAIGTTMASMNQNILRRISLPLPPLQEQKMIAGALSDADALIESLEQLIAKKRQIKQGAMQALLTGKRRLPGFDKKWVAKRVVDFGEVITGGTPRTDINEYWGGAYPWITPTDIKSRRDIYTSERTVTTEGLKMVGRVPADTVLVTCIASIGKNAILKREGGCNQQINAVIPNKEHSANFLYYLFEANAQLLVANAGTTATSIISKKTFQELVFEIPEIPEQIAIASILGDMDAEIAALDEKLNKARQIKQGMMQELLTGRIRLNVETQSDYAQDVETGNGST